MAGLHRRAVVNRGLEEAAGRLVVDRAGGDRLRPPLDGLEDDLGQRRQLADADHPEVGDVYPPARVGVAVLPVVLGLEGGADLVRRGVRRERHPHVPLLALVVQVELVAEAGVARLEPLAAERVGPLRLQRGVTLGERLAHPVGELAHHHLDEVPPHVGVLHPDRAERARLARDVNRAGSEHAAHARPVHRPGPAAGDEGETARVVAALDRNALDRVQQVLLDDADYPGRGLGEREAERLGDLLRDGALGGFEVERDRASGIGSRPEPPQHQMRVGDGGPGSAEPVGGRPRPRARALRSRIHHAGGVYPRDGAAAGADGVNVDRGGDEVVVGDRERVGDRDAPLAHQHDVATRPADLHADEVALAEPLREVLDRADAGRRARQQEVHRLLDELVERGRAAVALQHQEPGFQPERRQPVGERGEVVGDARHDIGVDRDGRDPLVLAHDRHDIGRDRDPAAEPGPAHDFRDRVLVRRVLEAVDQADRDRVHPFFAEGLDGGAHVVERDRLDLAAVGADPPAHRQAEIARHQHGRVGGAVVPRVLAQAAPRLEAVAEPSRRQQPDPPALALQQRVGRHGRAVQEERAVAEERGEREPERRARLLQRRDRPRARILRHRRHLEHRRPSARVGDHEIGERPPHVDAHAPGGCGEAVRCVHASGQMISMLTVRAGA